MRNLDGPAGAIDWIGAVDQALFTPTGIRLAFQPIVDLQRAVVAGYEVLARFDVPRLPSSPLPWLNAARDQGRLAALEQTVLVKALEARHHLQPNVFLSVNLSAGVLLESTTAALFAGAGDLRGVVIEITEHDRVLDYDALREAFQPTRDAGAMLGVDDAGAGYASLGHVLALRPEFVKLDRDLVSDLDHEHGRCAAVAAIGALAGELDGWLVAEGIERAGELDALVGLDVPLGQGYFLGRPAFERADVPQEVVAQLRGASRRGRVGQPVRSLVQEAPMRPADAGWASLLEEAAAAAAAGPEGPARGAGLGRTDAGWTGVPGAGRDPGSGWPDAPTGPGGLGSGPGGLDVGFGGLGSGPGGLDVGFGGPGSGPGGLDVGFGGLGAMDAWFGSTGSGLDGIGAADAGLGGMDAGLAAMDVGLGATGAGWPDPRSGLGRSDGQPAADPGWPGTLAGAATVPPVVVLVDDHGAPVALELDGRPASWGPRPMTVLAGEPIAEVALRCANRPAEERLLPVVCCDGRGRALGIVTVDALLHALARQHVESARR